MFSKDLTDGAKLSLLEHRHSADVFGLVDSNREHLRRWLPWVDGTKTVDDSRGFIRSSLERFAQGDGFDAGIWQDGQLAGVIGLHYIHWHHRRSYLGYWLGQEFTGRGLMTRACETVLEHCFTELDLNSVGSAAATGNSPSNAVLRRVGFQFEGVTRDAEWLYDHFVNHNAYSVLGREWREGKRA
jgi:ribosomal-protein-serine acetyltransferase